MYKFQRHGTTVDYHWQTSIDIDLEFSSGVRGGAAGEDGGFLLWQ